MKELINYTAQDIERYHSGGLSPAQMHALEKAALEDPFLADALEGYTYTQTASADLTSLQQKLKQRIEKDEERSVFFMSNNWMKIAALFLVIAGGGWFIIQSLSPSKNEVAIAASDNNNKQQSPIINRDINADSASTFLDTPVSNETVSTSKSVSAAPRQEEYKTRNKNNYNTPLVVPSANSLLRQQGNEVTATATAPYRDIDKEKDQADVTAMQKKEGVNSRSRTNDTIRNVDVVLQRTEGTLEEVVVNPKAKANTQASRKMMMQIDTLEPANGWGYFDDYIASNIKSPGDLKIKPVSGEVELSFDLNKDGEPVNITVTKSLCDKCDEEAIRLLKQGPKWKNKGKKGKVKIRF